jgi:hypothetical protein
MKASGNGSSGNWEQRGMKAVGSKKELEIKASRNKSY